MGVAHRIPELSTVAFACRPLLRGTTANSVRAMPNRIRIETFFLVSILLALRILRTRASKGTSVFEYANKHP